MKTWTNDKVKQSEDEWVLNRLVLNNPKEFLPKKEKLKFQLEHMPFKYKNGLKYEILLAEKYKVDVDLLTRSILSKKYGSYTKIGKTENKVVSLNTNKIKTYKSSLTTKKEKEYVL